MTRLAMPKQIRVVAAIVEREGRYLITQRRRTAVMPLLWEFPGGKVEEGETDEGALQREVRERLGVDIVVGRKIGERRHTYSSHEVVLALYAATLVPNQSMRSRRINDFRWVLTQDLGGYPFPDADDEMKKYVTGE